MDLTSGIPGVEEVGNIPTFQHKHFSWGVAQAGGANLPLFQLVNPPASPIYAVVRQVSFTASAGAGVDLYLDNALLGAPVGAFWKNLAEVNIPNLVVRAGSAAAPGGTLWGRLPASSFMVTDYFKDVPYVLPPNTGLVFYGTAVATQLQIYAEWFEVAV